MSLIPSSFGNRRRSSSSSSSLLDPFSFEAWDPFNFNNRRLMVPLSNEVPHIDWKETPEAHVFKADLPGMREEEVKVKVEEGRILQISGERNREKEEINTADNWHRIERSTGKFIRRFRLPENARLDGVRATMENSVLTVTVPKAMEARSPQSMSKKTIQIAG